MIDVTLGRKYEHSAKESYVYQSKWDESVSENEPSMSHFIKKYLHDNAS